LAVLTDKRLLKGLVTRYSLGAPRSQLAAFYPGPSTCRSITSTLASLFSPQIIWAGLLR